ncbi:MAG: hypothetical protein K0U41_06575 [Gammaproteobacteria bacterium]|nr:hypothetical protein [Gammaproteobacteria bacterium]
MKKFMLKRAEVLSVHDDYFTCALSLEKIKFSDLHWVHIGTELTGRVMNIKGRNDEILTLVGPDNLLEAVNSSWSNHVYDMMYDNQALMHEDQKSRDLLVVRHLVETLKDYERCIDKYNKYAILMGLTQTAWVYKTSRKRDLTYTAMPKSHEYYENLVRQSEDHHRELKTFLINKGLK